MRIPKLVTTLKNYSVRQFSKDLIAGTVVGVVALPLAIAFAIASGVTPDKGLITAIVAGFLISALGGSRVQIGGPTGAFVVIVYGVVQKHGVDGLIISTFLAGILLTAFGIAGIGNAIKYIPHPVVVGFTSGIAVLIFSSQVKDFLGLSIDKVPADFLEKYRVLGAHLDSVNPYAFLIALGTVLLIAVWPRVSRRVPGSVVALILTSVLVHFLKLPVETIGSRFGELPSQIALPHLPSLDFSNLRELLHPAFTIALLGAIESLLSALVADGMIGGRHRPNMELIAQGAANIFSSLFGGIPATGAIARTVTNIKNGGRTPVAGIVHALVLLLIVLFFGRWAKLIPLACLAGILTMVAYHMSEWRPFLSLLKGIRSGAVVLLATFLITVLVDLTVAIEIGLILSVILFLRHLTHATVVRFADEGEHAQGEQGLQKLKVPKGVDVYEVHGPLFFAVAGQFEEAVRNVADRPKVRILRLRHVPVIDATGIEVIREFFEDSHKHKTRLLLSGLQPTPLEKVQKAGLYDQIGRENFCQDIHEALKIAEDYLAAAGAKPHPAGPTL